MPETQTSAARAPGAQIPPQPSERTAWAIAAALVVLGAGVLVAVLSGVVGQTRQTSVAQPPAVVTVATTPLAAPASSAAAATTARRALAPAPIVARAGSPTQRRELASYYVSQTSTQTHINADWMAGFYPIYAEAQRTFGVNWLLLASIHRQESAFSTAAGIYHGLNFAGCCGGPMQFNVTNGGAGTPSTWALVSDSYRYGHRPASYDHETARHPSIYDDFDAIMAAGRLLSADGATLALDEGAWDAAYDYYGHDAAGVTYADQVLARAIGWSQHGWCINCGIAPELLAAVHGAYGAPVLAALEASEAAAAAQAKKQRRTHAKRRG